MWSIPADSHSAKVLPADFVHPLTLCCKKSNGSRSLKLLPIYPSAPGIDGFSNVNRTHIEAALPVLKRNGVPYLVHAEIVDDDIQPQVCTQLLDVQIVLFSP